MRSAWCALLLLVAACGRHNFDDASTDSVVVEDAAIAGLVAHYRMETDPATGVVDSFGGHDGTCTACPMQVPGRLDGAYYFDGITDSVTIPHDPAFSITGGVTVAAWIYQPTAPPVGGHCPVSKLLGTSIQNSWQLCFDDALRFTICTDTLVTPGCINSGPGLVATARWQHLAMTWDGSTTRGYVDGVERMQNPSLMGLDNGSILFGHDIDNAVPFGYYEGLLDDVMIFSRALSPTELVDLAQ